MIFWWISPSYTATAEKVIGSTSRRSCSTCLMRFIRFVNRIYLVVRGAHVTLHCSPPSYSSSSPMATSRQLPEQTDIVATFTSFLQYVVSVLPVLHSVLTYILLDHRPHCSHGCQLFQRSEYCCLDWLGLLRRLHRNHSGLDLYCKYWYRLMFIPEIETYDLFITGNLQYYISRMVLCACIVST